MENIRNMFAYGFGKRDVADLKDNKGKLRKNGQSQSFDESLDSNQEFDNKYSRIRSVSECSTSSMDEQTLAQLSQLAQQAQNTQAASNNMEKEAYFWIMWRS